MKSQVKCASWIVHEMPLPAHLQQVRAVKVCEADALGQARALKVRQPQRCGHASTRVQARMRQPTRFGKA